MGKIRCRLSIFESEARWPFVRSLPPSPTHSPRCTRSLCMYSWRKYATARKTGGENQSDISSFGSPSTVRISPQVRSRLLFLAENHSRLPSPWSIPTPYYTKLGQNSLPLPFLPLPFFRSLLLSLCYCSETPACSSFRPHMQLRDTAATPAAAMAAAAGEVVYFCEITRHVLLGHDDDGNFRRPFLPSSSFVSSRTCFSHIRTKKLPKNWPGTTSRRRRRRTTRTRHGALFWQRGWSWF